MGIASRSRTRKQDPGSPLCDQGISKYIIMRSIIAIFCAACVMGACVMLTMSPEGAVVEETALESAKAPAPAPAKPAAKPKPAPKAPAPAPAKKAAAPAPAKPAPKAPAPAPAKKSGKKSAKKSAKKKVKKAK